MTQISALFSPAVKAICRPSGAYNTPPANPCILDNSRTSPPGGGDQVDAVALARGERKGPERSVRRDGQARFHVADSAVSARNCASSISTSTNGSARTTSFSAGVASRVQRPPSSRSTSSVRSSGSTSHVWATCSRA